MIRLYTSGIQPGEKFFLELQDLFIEEEMMELYTPWTATYGWIYTREILEQETELADALVLLVRKDRPDTFLSHREVELFSALQKRIIVLAEEGVGPEAVYSFDLPEKTPVFSVNFSDKESILEAAAGIRAHIHFSGKPDPRVRISPCMFSRKDLVEEFISRLFSGTIRPDFENSRSGYEVLYGLEMDDMVRKFEQDTHQSFTLADSLKMVRIFGEIGSFSAQYYWLSRVMDEGFACNDPDSINEAGAKQFRLLAGKYRTDNPKLIVKIDTAINSREPDLCVSIGRLYEYGNLVERDLDLAEEFYELAGVGLNSFKQHYLSRIWRKKANKRIRYLFPPEFERYSLEEIFDHAEGIRRNGLRGISPEEAFPYYAALAERGLPEAMLVMAAGQIDPSLFPEIRDPHHISSKENMEYSLSPYLAEIAAFFHRHGKGGGGLEQARAWLEQIPDRDEDPMVLNFLGWILSQSDSRKERNDARFLLYQASNHIFPYAHYNLARISMMNGDMDSCDYHTTKFESYVH